MDKQKSSAAVLKEKEASEFTSVKLTQLDSVCEKPLRSVSVSTNLGSDKGMEKKERVLLNCKSCSRAKSSYDNHALSAFAVVIALPPRLALSLAISLKGDGIKSSIPFILLLECTRRLTMVLLLRLKFPWNRLK